MTKTYSKQSKKKISRVRRQVQINVTLPLNDKEQVILSRTGGSVVLQFQTRYYKSDPWGNDKKYAVTLKNLQRAVRLVEEDVKITSLAVKK